MAERGVPGRGSLSIWFHGGLRSNPNSTPECGELNAVGKGVRKRAWNEFLHVLKIW